MPHRVWGIAMVVVLVAAACVERRELADDGVPPTTVAPSTALTLPPTSITPSTTSPTTTTKPCSSPRDGSAPSSGELVAALDSTVSDPRFSDMDVSVAVWVDGLGEIAARDPDHRLLPASNQKLLTAMGALEVLGVDHRFTTTVQAGALPNAGRVDGDLVLVAGGDPTLGRTGAHSLAALARQVRAAGITEVLGGIVVDESRYDDRREADGWLDWQRPTYAGALSALVVDGNQHRGDPAYLADPALGNAELLRQALASVGVRVTGGVAHGRVHADATEVARVESAPVGALVDRMLMRSDNMVAESLVKEIDAASGGVGSTAGGLARIRAALLARCIQVEGVDADGSGLSRANARSAREWAAMLTSARDAPWATVLLDSLPLAGRSGTLAGRLTSAATAGNVRAKTGSIIPGRALSGYVTTASGRSGVFSVVVNGDNPGRAQAAIDALVTSVAAIDV